LTQKNAISQIYSKHEKIGHICDLFFSKTSVWLQFPTRLQQWLLAPWSTCSLKSFEFEFHKIFKNSLMIAGCFSAGYSYGTWPFFYTLTQFSLPEVSTVLTFELPLDVVLYQFHPLLFSLNISL